MTPALVIAIPTSSTSWGCGIAGRKATWRQPSSAKSETFLLVLGAGFCFVAHQKRIQIDDEDFHLDLLFYNRKLRRLVAVELKIGEFKAAHKGRIELYLRWLDKHEREPEEASPLGIILCTGKKREQIELLELDKSANPRRRVPDSLAAEGRSSGAATTATQRAQLQLDTARNAQRLALSQTDSLPNVPLANCPYLAYQSPKTILVEVLILR